MSLALPRQPAGERASQVLPSVNCSTCHNPVLIIELGTHVCSSPPPPPRLPSSSSSQPPSRPSNQRSSTASAASIGKWLPTRRPSKPELEPPLKPPPSNLFGGGSQGRRGSNSSNLSSSSSNNSSSMSSSRSPKPSQQYGSSLPKETLPVSRPQPSRNQTLPQLSVHNPNPPYSPNSATSNSSPHLPRPSISFQHSHNNPLPSPPLNPYQLRPSPNDPSPQSFQPAASSFHQPTPSYAGSYTTRTPSPIDYSGVKSSILKTEVGGDAGMAGVGRRAFALATATNNQNLYPHSPHSLYAAPISPNGSLSPASSPSSPYPPLPASSSGHGSQPSHGSSVSSHVPPSSASSRPPGPSRHHSATSSNGSSNRDGSERKPQNKLPFLEKYQELVRGSSQSSTKGLGLGAGRSGSSDGGRKSSDGGGRRSVAVEEDDDDSETELPWARDDVDDKPSSIRSGLLHAVRETSSGSGSSTYSDPQTARNSRAAVLPSTSRPSSPLTSSVQSHSSSNPNGSSSNHNHRASGFRIEEEEGFDAEEEDEQTGSGSVASSSSVSHGQSRNGKTSSLMTPSTSLDRLTREELTARAVANGNGKVGGDAFQGTRGGSQGSSGSGGSKASSSSSGLRILGGLKTRLGAEGLEDLVEELELTEEPLPISPTSDNDDDDDPSLDGPVQNPPASSSYTVILRPKSTASSSSSILNPKPTNSTDLLQVTPPAPATERSRSPSPVSQFHSPSLSHASSSHSHSSGGLAVPGASRKKECLQCGEAVGGSTGRKYVQMKEGTGMMCEKDWKNMYLPKCRRCALPIESQAISSADGQLKGKYHRACFTCYACDKPFYGQTFWVHGSRPYCEHDYHRENNSLCASPTCGKPIEGSCAVLQTKKGEERYHTHCLRCADPSESCSNSMDEHYDVSGFRFCRTHVASAWERQQTEARLSGGRGTPRPTKRMTLIMELPRGR